MIPRQRIAPGQLTDPGVNFASTPVTVHMSFKLPRGNLERWATRCTAPGNLACWGNSMWTERKSCPEARVVLGMIIINVYDKFLNKKFQKSKEIGKRV